MRRNTLSSREMRAVRAELEQERDRFTEHDARRERYALALERIADGRYGICESCGTDISADRLLAIPETSRCLTCSARGAPVRRVHQLA